MVLVNFYSDCRCVFGEGHDLDAEVLQDFGQGRLGVVGEVDGTSEGVVAAAILIGSGWQDPDALVDEDTVDAAGSDVDVLRDPPAGAMIGFDESEPGGGAHPVAAGDRCTHAV